MDERCSEKSDSLTLLSITVGCASALGFPIVAHVAVTDVDSTPAQKKEEKKKKSSSSKSKASERRHTGCEGTRGGWGAATNLQVPGSRCQ